MLVGSQEPPFLTNRDGEMRSQGRNDVSSSAMNRNVLTPISEIAHGGDHLLFVDEEADDLRINDARLWRCMLTRLGMKRARFQGCSFLQSTFRSCYFREAGFTNVDFTGSVFEDCNLERASFHSCSLRYTRFRDCLLNVDEILETLPPEPNLRYQVLRALEQNERGLGHRRVADRLSVAVLETRKEELWKRVRAQSTYYKERFNAGSQIVSLLQVMALSLSGAIWGYGLRIGRLLLSGAAFVTLIGALIALLSLPYVAPGHASASALSFGEAMYLSSLSFATLGFGGYTPASWGSQAICVLAGLSGAVFVGFLAASLFRRIAR